MKKETKKIVPFIFIIIVFIILTSIGTAYAAILFISANVSYDNTASGLSATNVQNAITELYNIGTDYTSLKSRTTTLENTMSSLASNYNTGVKTKNVSSGTVTAIASKSSVPAGIYLVGGHVDFEDTSSYNGYRYIFLSFDNCSTRVSVLVSSRMAPLKSDYSMGSALYFLSRISISESTTMYLCAQQNSGATLSTSGNLEIYKYK